MVNIKNMQRGFGLIEVLIAAAILAIGLVGLASLQNNAIQSIQEADNLATAAAIAEETAFRMLSNPYITAQGRQGYLQPDLGGEPDAHGAVNWSDGILASYPNVVNCYSADNTQSCYEPNATIGNSAAHIQALQNMMLMDQIDMRLLAFKTLPSGEIRICFDASSPFTSWSCDDVATRVATRNENVFTVKVRWRNLFSDSTQVYAIRFTAQCTDGSADYCG